MNDIPKEMLDIMKNYLNARLEIIQMSLGKRIAVFSSSVLFLMVFFIISLFVLFFLSFAFVFWYEKHIGHLHHGFFIIAGFYVLMMVIMFIGRKRFFINPFLKRTGEALMTNKGRKINSIDELEIEIERAKLRAEKQENKLDHKYKQLLEELSFKSVINKTADHVLSSPQTIMHAVWLGYKIFSRKKKK